jgi:DNA-binding Lrp family transcriptional regulator
MHTPSPSVQMVQLLAGFQVSQALYAAAKLGVANQLDAGPRTSAEVAATLGVDPPSLARLMRSLTGLGVLTAAGADAYALTPLGRTLVAGSPGSMHDVALMWMETHYAPFGGLVDTVRTGRCAADEHYGMPFFQWLSGDPEQVARFSGAMANLTDGIKKGAIAGYDFGDATRLVDLGGADGALLAQVLGRLPDATGVVYDLPHVVEAVPAVAKSHQLEGRLTGEAGDFFDHVPAGADTYLLSMVLHDWDDAAAARLLRNVAAAAPSGTRVRAFELVMPDGDAPHMAKMIDLTMLAMMNGRERDEASLRALFHSAGLRYERTVATASPMSVIEASVA